MLLWTPRCSGPVSGPLPASPLASADSHYLCNVRPWLLQGLGCYFTCCPTWCSLRTFSHVLREDCGLVITQHHCLSPPPRAARVEDVSSHVLRKIPSPPDTVRLQSLVGHLNVGMVVVPPCHVWSTFCTSLGTPRRWSLCLKGLYANGVLHLSLGFALLGFPRSCTRLLWSVRFPASASGARSRRSSMRVVTTLECDQHSFPPQLSPLRACGYVPRGQWALLDTDMPKLIDRSACLVEPVVVESLCSSRACAVPALSTSSAASGRCSRLYPIARPC